MSFSCFCCHRSLQKFRHSPVEKTHTHMFKLLVTKANPICATEETFKPPIPPMFKKRPKWSHVGEEYFSDNFGYSLCLFLTIQTVLLSFSSPLDCEQSPLFCEGSVRAWSFSRLARFARRTKEKRQTCW